MNALHVGVRPALCLLSVILLAASSGCGGKGSDSNAAQVDPQIGERRKEMKSYMETNKTSAAETRKSTRNHP